VGQTLQLAATGVGLIGARRDVSPFVTWSSSNPAVAAISSTGLATALAPGTTTLGAALDVYRVPGLPPGRLTATTLLTVLPALTGITIPPGTLGSPVGETLQLQALGAFSDASTRDLTPLVTWASSNPAVATVTAGGLVTAKALGVANITAGRDGIVGTLALTVTGARPSITITSPANGATITADRVIVRGTASGAPGDIGVTVNGFPALVNGGQWAIELPLAPGANVISAAATDSTGAQFTTSLDVTVPQATRPSMLLRGVPDSGVAPLPVTFTAINQTGRPLVQFEFDPLGKGTFAPLPPTFDTFATTYTGAGLMLPTLRATDDQGRVYTATTVVNIEAPDTVTARFQALWTSFKARLQAGDIPGALAHLTPKLQARFQTVFQLGADLPAIGAGLGNLEVLNQVGNLAETVIVQAENGTPSLYFIYFRRTPLGQWLIEEM